MRSGWWASLWLRLLLFPRALFKLGAGACAVCTDLSDSLSFYCFSLLQIFLHSLRCVLSPVRLSSAIFSRTSQCTLSLMWGGAVQDSSCSCSPKMFFKSMGHPGQNTLWFSLQSQRHFFSGNGIHPRCWECMLSNLSISFRGWCSQSANVVLSFQKHKSLGQEGEVLQ